MRSFQRSQHLTRPASSAIKIRWVVLFAACALVCGCSGPEKPKVEGSAQSSATPAPQQQMAKLPPPELDQIQQAVKRVFKDSALVDTARKPSYVAGDFN